MSNVVRIAQGAVNAKLVSSDPQVGALAQQLLSYTEDGFEYMQGVSQGGWDGRNSFYDYASGIFPAGMVVRLYRELKHRGYNVDLVRKPLPVPLGKKNPKVDDFPEDARYDYQAQVVSLLERYGQIIAQVATGGGKSRIAKLAVMRIKRPTLFLTTRGILMHQMRDAFRRDLKMRVGCYGDGHHTGEPEIFNVGMVQSFAAWIVSEPEKTAALLRKFEFVILEEAHEASSDSYFNILRLCTSAVYRLALTATPFMKDSEKANLQLEASSGPVAIKVSEKMLIDRGILARPFFKFARIDEPYPLGAYWAEKDGERVELQAKLYKTSPYERAYELGVSGGISRNQTIVDEVVRASKHGLSTMVLVQRKAHGARLERLLQAAGVRCAWIEGEDSQERRQAAIQALKRGSIDCLIGSTILDVGVDVPAVGLVILAGAGKAEVAVRQRIGRGLREKRGGVPNVCFILDFEDPINNHLRDHARERRQIVDTTPGFAEGVVADFPYSTYFVEKAVA